MSFTVEHVEFYLLVLIRITSFVIYLWLSNDSDEDPAGNRYGTVACGDSNGTGD